MIQDRQDNPIKTIYIAGKVTGLDYALVKQKFAAAETFLRERYPHAAIINPTSIVPSTATWPQAIKTCINALIEADTIYLLPCWKNSKGAKIELQIAESLGLEVYKGSCHLSCGPSDHCKGGKCDKAGCYESRPTCKHHNYCDYPKESGKTCLPSKACYESEKNKPTY